MEVNRVKVSFIPFMICQDQCSFLLTTRVTTKNRNETVAVKMSS